MSTRTIGTAITLRPQEHWQPRQLGDLLIQQDTRCATPPTLGGSPVHQEERPLVNPHDRHNNHVVTPRGLTTQRAAGQPTSAQGRAVHQPRQAGTLLPPRLAGVLLTRRSGHLSTRTIGATTTSRPREPWQPLLAAGRLASAPGRAVPPRQAVVLHARRSGYLSSRTIGLMRSAGFSRMRLRAFSISPQPSNTCVQSGLRSRRP